MIMVNPEKSQLYKIGAIARLTGITPVTIRMWQTRYDAVEPVRTEGKQRLYTENDLTKLILLKELTDQGDSIGMIASLSVDELEKRLDELEAKRGPKGNQSNQAPIKVAVLGYGIPQLSSAEVAAHAAPLELVGQFNPENALSNDVKACGPDLLIFQIASLQPDSLDLIHQAIRQSEAIGACVVYAFGSKKVVRNLTTDTILPLRAPINVEELTLAANHLVGSADRTQIHEEDERIVQQRRYSDSQLWEIVNQPNAIKCECPQHLSHILFSLNNFEAYMKDCENRNTKDAEVHQYLHNVAAESRACLEKAMDKLVEHENLTFKSQ
jgi:DNA-binding transcriptional MerR regulator